MACDDKNNQHPHMEKFDNKIIAQTVQYWRGTAMHV